MLSLTFTLYHHQPPRLNATRLGVSTGLGYLGSLRELDSTQSLHVFRVNNGLHHGYRCCEQTTSAPPKNEASTSPRRPDQWSPFSPVFPLSLNEHKKTTLWLQFQTTSSRRHHDQWDQWQCQWTGFASR